MGTHDTENDVVILDGKEPSNVLTFVPRASWNAEIGVSIPGSVARQPLVRAVNRAIADFGIWPETIERRAAAMPNSPIRPRHRIGRVSVELLTHDRLHRVREQLTVYPTRHYRVNSALTDVLGYSSQSTAQNPKSEPSPGLILCSSLSAVLPPMPPNRAA